MKLGDLFQLSRSSRGLTLKGRLVVCFLRLMLLVALLFSFLEARQNRFFVERARMATHFHQEMSVIHELRVQLAEIGRQVSAGQSPIHAIERFRSLIRRLESEFFRNDSKAALQTLRSSVDSYFNLIKYSSRVTDEDLVRRQYDYVAAIILSYTELTENSIFSWAKNLESQEAQSKLIEWALIGGFMILVLLVNLRMISVITKPITGLAKSLDDFNPDEDFPCHFPQPTDQIPEVALFAKSFEKLLKKLKGYKDLNVGRLLIEKRRADIIAGSISDGVLLVRDGDIVYVNPIGERILALAPEEQGVNCHLNLNEGSSSHSDSSGIQAIHRALTSALPVELKLEVNDRKFYYLIQSFQISYDLIEKTEESLDVAAKTFLDRFQADTLILAQDISLVKASQEAKGYFLATLSHEVKTPVTSLTLATRLLKKSIDQIPSSSQRSLILTCVEDVDRLRGLLDDFFKVSQFDTLTQRLDIQRVDFGKLLIHSIESFQRRAVERGVELIYKGISQTGSIVVSMDPTKIAWALSNLVINAIRHTPRGGKVEVFLTAKEDGAEIRVKDSGPGIEPHRQGRIFDKFNPYYDLRVARSGSMGAGLAIAKEIVLAHSGHIWVKSELGSGSEFCFRLPFFQPTPACGMFPSFSDGVVGSKHLKKMKGDSCGSYSGSR